MSLKKTTSYCTLLVLSVLAFLFFTDLQAQQESQYSQYTYNTMSFNPAYAGARGRLSVLGMYRNQWAGIKGAPETLNFSIASPLGQIGRVGAGAEFISDKIGPSTQSTIAGNFSYVIPFENGFHWSFGVKAGITTLNIDPNKLDIYDYHGVYLDLTDRTMPVFGVGTYFYASRWYLGVSSPNLLETKHFDDVKISQAAEKMHLYMIGGYYIPVNPDFYLKPGFLVKAVSGAPLAVDVSLNSTLYNKIGLGIGYRFDAAISFLTGFQINDNFMLGYTYDYTTSELNRYNKGAHEIILRFEIGEKREGRYTVDGNQPLF